jgi:hypothetical protein
MTPWIRRLMEPVLRTIPTPSAGRPLAEAASYLRGERINGIKRAAMWNTSTFLGGPM